MTREQLDEIEKLAEVKNRAGLLSRTDQLLLVIKALREAWARCETLRDLADEKAHAAGLFARRMEEAQKARAEARAEVARLKEHLRHIAYEHCDSPVHYAMNQLEDE